MQNEKLAIRRAIRGDPFFDRLISLPEAPPRKTFEMAMSWKGLAEYVHNMPNHSRLMHLDALRYFTKWVAASPHRSQLQALAYADRGRFLRHLYMYEDALKDINRALEIGTPFMTYTRLLLYKSVCLIGLDRSKDEITEVLNEACAATDSVENGKELREVLEDNIAVTESKKEGESPEYRPGPFDEFPELNRIPRCKVTDEPLDHVHIRYQEKFQRCLVASREFRPGEIVFVEKPYVLVPHSRRNFAFCSYCWKTCWSQIPCDDCHWGVFCSEECKDKGWEEFHSLECKVMPHLAHFEKELETEIDFLASRTMIKGLREAGNISKLRDIVETVEKCRDKKKRGCGSDGKFSYKKFQGVMSLSYNVNIDDEVPCLKKALYLLYGFMRYSSLFGSKKFNFADKRALSNDKDVIFIGALLLRLAKIRQVNQLKVNTGCHRCLFYDDMEDCFKNECCYKGMCIAPLACTMNHSCNPNVKILYNVDDEIVVYAVQPIKKNSQIFYSYTGFFFDKPSEVRQKQLISIYNFKCDCIACRKNWPQADVFFPSMKEKIDAPENEAQKKFFERFTTFYLTLGKNDIMWDDCGEALFQDILDEAKRVTVQPSPFLYWIVFQFMVLIERSWSNRFDVPLQCDDAN